MGNSSANTEQQELIVSPSVANDALKKELKML
jgi:hypothetical protein